jgi:hypothetical protein
VKPIRTSGFIERWNETQARVIADQDATIRRLRRENAKMRRALELFLNRCAPNEWPRETWERTIEIGRAALSKPARPARRKRT